MSSLIVEVSKVESVEKHPNADRLSVVKVKGWYCVTGLDEYKVGDLVVFVPPDSIIPEKTIEKYNIGYLKNDNRVKSTRIRGIMSYGLILSINGENWKEGQDVASYLGITKYDPGEADYARGGQQTSRKKRNPLFDKYTDIENIMNFDKMLIPGEVVVITEKIHGTNSRYGNLPIFISEYDGFFEKIRRLWRKHILKETYEFCIGSHTVQLKAFDNKTSFKENVYSIIERKYNLSKIIPKGYILYGEIYGKGIQDLTYGLNTIDFVAFDIKKPNGKYMSWNDFSMFCKYHRIPTVPVLYIGTYGEDLIEKYVSGNSLIAGSQIREGIVIKSYTERDSIYGRVILKALNPAYLLRKGGTEYK